MLKIFLVFFFTVSIINPSHAKEGYCSIFQECDNAVQTTSKSLPSSSSAISFNPSNISKFYGLGVEILYQPNNPVGYNLITGNGSFGGALISPAAESSFFGNRAIEIDDLYKQRRSDKKRFRTKKLSLAFGASLIDTDPFGVDIGVSIRRNPAIKKINPGFGLSTHLYFFNIGANVYRDDTRFNFDSYKNPETGVEYATQYKSETYQETFLVKTFSAGLNFGFLTFDAGLIKTQYDFYKNETSIYIYSSSFKYNDFIFNIAHRTEFSDNLKYSGAGLYKDREKKDIYGGIKYIWNSYITTGISYNNFLVHDISLSLSLFF